MSSGRGGAEFDWNVVVVRFENLGHAVQASVGLPAGESASIGSLRPDFAPDFAALQLDHRLLAEVVRHMGRAAPEGWKQLAAYQRGRVWPNDPPLAAPRRSPVPRRAEVLQWLGEKAGLEYVSDYYSYPCTVLQPGERSLPLVRPLKQELDYRAAEQDMSWTQRPGGVYLFRHNRWYRNDRLEVPAPLLRRWRARLAQLARLAAMDRDAPARGGAPRAEGTRARLEWEAEVVAALTPWQIGTGLTWSVADGPPESEAPGAAPQARPGSAMERALPFFRESDRILRELHMLRFYAGLGPDQRAALLAARLPVPALSPAQREQAVFLVPGLAEALEGAPTLPTLLGLQVAANSAAAGASSPPRFRLVLVPTG